ncbi:aldose 1-epimerase family protein [Streptomyces sp. SPB162]|uniref:aldose 1-epimerase family protein n=1 Tax=Streptomyces sp. SPB162 TaxID=2940560 RepID=UPI002406376E|nr:aldose 1-epimerase family protein [Streptomyces sp. SPB162]MDF9817113.1 aldose 1-epimerase [Streptomyces sp. SPB162]
MSESPSGQQILLRHGEQTAVVVELGGALRDYSVDGRPVLDGFSADERIAGGRGQLLVPWPNRIGGGRYRWQDQDLQLPLTEPENGNAIHGLLRWTSWHVIEREEHRVLLGVTLWPQPGYPFHLDVRVGYVLGAEGLTVTVVAHNLGEDTAPYGVGQHPYLTVGTETVDDAMLLVPAGKWLPLDDTGMPVAAEDVTGTPFDFRTAKAVGAQRLDTAFADLERNPSGRAVVRLAHPTGAHGTDLWLGEGAEYVQVYTGDTLPARRRRGIAVEPMSCPPDAFRSRDGLVELGPGALHTFRWGLHAWRRQD